MIDLTSTNAADSMFIAITSMDPTPERANMIREFCKTFWAQLSENHRNAYRTCYINPSRDGEDDTVYLAGDAAYNIGMANQDRETMSH